MWSSQNTNRCVWWYELDKHLFHLSPYKWTVILNIKLAYILNGFWGTHGSSTVSNVLCPQGSTYNHYIDHSHFREICVHTYHIEAYKCKHKNAHSHSFSYTHTQTHIVAAEATWALFSSSPVIIHLWLSSQFDLHAQISENRSVSSSHYFSLTADNEPEKGDRRHKVCSEEK